MEGRNRKLCPKRKPEPNGSGTLGYSSLEIWLIRLNHCSGGLQSRRRSGMLSFAVAQMAKLGRAENSFSGEDR